MGKRLNAPTPALETTSNSPSPGISIIPRNRTNDPRVPVTESRQMVERVRSNQQPVSYIEGANEGHGFRNPWNSLYASTAQFLMLEECLAG